MNILYERCFIKSCNLMCVQHVCVCFFCLWGFVGVFEMKSEIDPPCLLLLQCEHPESERAARTSTVSKNGNKCLWPVRLSCTRAIFHFWERAPEQAKRKKAEVKKIFQSHLIIPEQDTEQAQKCRVTTRESKYIRAKPVAETFLCHHKKF